MKRTILFITFFVSLNASAFTLCGNLQKNSSFGFFIETPNSEKFEVLISHSANSKRMDQLQNFVINNSVSTLPNICITGSMLRAGRRGMSDSVILYATSSY